MECAEAAKGLARHLADPSEEVDAHLAACAGCRARLQSLEASLSRFASLPRREPPASVWARIEEGMAREAVRLPQAAPASPRRWAWFVPAWGLAAAALVLVALFVRMPRIVRVTDGIAEFETDGQPLRVETPCGVVSMESGRIVVECSDAVHVDVRVIRGRARAESRDVEAGSWVTLSPGLEPRVETIGEYDVFVRERDLARKAGDKFGTLLRVGKATVFDFKDFGWASMGLTRSRSTAELVTSASAAQLGLDGAKKQALRDAIAWAAEEGRRAGLPANWIEKDAWDDIARAQQAVARHLKNAVLARLSPAMTAAQLHELRNILEHEEDGGIEDEDCDDR